MLFLGSAGAAVLYKSRNDRGEFERDNQGATHIHSSSLPRLPREGI